MKNIKTTVPIDCDPIHCGNCQFVVKAAIYNYCQFFTAIKGSPVMLYATPGSKQFKRLVECIDAEVENDQNS
jgi:hypothetical protein